MEINFDKKKHNELEKHLHFLQTEIKKIDEEFQKMKVNFADFVIKNEETNQKITDEEGQEKMKQITKKEEEHFLLQEEISNVKHQFFEPYVSVLEEKHISFPSFLFLLEVDALIEKYQLSKSKATLKKLEECLRLFIESQDSR